MYVAWDKFPNYVYGYGLVDVALSWHLGCWIRGHWAALDYFFPEK